MIELKNVLVATDFSDASNAALLYGRAIARSFAATLAVLHVADVVTTGIGDAGGKFDQVQHDADENARAQADALLTTDDRVSLHARATAVTSIDPAQAIVSYATDVGADVIVMGTHGRSGMTHLLMGSVAEGVVRAAPCPVLVVKHAERKGPVSTRA